MSSPNMILEMPEPAAGGKPEKYYHDYLRAADDLEDRIGKGAAWVAKCKGDALNKMIAATGKSMRQLIHDHQLTQSTAYRDRSIDKNFSWKEVESQTIDELLMEQKKRGKMAGVVIDIMTAQEEAGKLDNEADDDNAEPTKTTKTTDAEPTKTTKTTDGKKYRIRDARKILDNFDKRIREHTKKLSTASDFDLVTIDSIVRELDELEPFITAVTEAVAEFDRERQKLGIKWNRRITKQRFLKLKRTRAKEGRKCNIQAVKPVKLAS
jgi:hypothetical protein